MATNIYVNASDSLVALKINASSDFGGNVAAAMADTANVATIPSLQDITINASPGTFTWEQLDSLSQLVTTTPSTNSINMNIVVDASTMFANTNATASIFNITRDKTLVHFRVYMNGTSSGDHYIDGKGYLSGLAMTTSPTAPVWVTPLDILVDGSITHNTV